MILFGWGHRRVKDFGPVKSNYCNNCRNESAWELKKVSVWFTLFFIPVIPYENHAILMCPVCNCGFEVGKAEFEEHKRKIESGDLYTEGSLHNSFAGKNETQVNFLREMEAFQREKARGKQEATATE